MDYRKTSQQICDNIGGRKNIISAEHCATRLRLVIGDNDKCSKEAIEAIENQNFIICPIRELSEDKKTVTVTYCSEAAAGAKVTAGGVTATIQSVEHIDGEPDGSGKAEKEKTKITLSRTIAAGSEAIKITNTPSVYDTLGMTEEELETIKADLQQ